MSETETHAASYEQECQRAELLGLQPPDKEEFERRRQARLEHAMAEQEAAEAAVSAALSALSLHFPCKSQLIVAIALQLLEQQDETLGSVGGKLGELNSILSSTQQKLNRFKQTACGSLTNIFSRATATATASAADTCPDAVAPSPAAACPEQRRPLEARPPPTAAEVAAAKADKQRRMDSQLDKLDALINQADNAQIAMSEQTQQMRRLAK
ncbi:hypothetical protein KR018_010055 [Drosophila ironensis]|nr:hypothetical protein KR018_010055 [Drosophila ironensis]